MTEDQWKYLLASSLSSVYSTTETFCSSVAEELVLFSMFTLAIDWCRFVVFCGGGQGGEGARENRGGRGTGGGREKGRDAGVSKSVGSGNEMQNATFCHLLMRYNTLKNKSTNDIWLALASSEQSSKQKLALLLKNRPTSSEIVNPFTGGYIMK